MKRGVLCLPIVMALSLGALAIELTSQNLLVVLEKEIGSKSNLGVKKFQRVWVETDIPDKLYEDALRIFAMRAGKILSGRTGIAVVYFVANDNLTRGLVKTGIRIDTTKIDQVAFTKFSDIQDLFVIAMFPVMDKYGNTQLDVVAIQYLTRGTFNKINWSLGLGAVSLLIERAADFFWWDPEF